MLAARRGRRRGDRPRGGRGRFRLRASASRCCFRRSPPLRGGQRCSGERERRPAAAAHASDDTGRGSPDRRRGRIGSRPSGHHDAIDGVENASERHLLSNLNPENIQDAYQDHQDHRQRRQADGAPAGHERVADQALRRHLRAGPRPAYRRPLHRLSARPRGHTAERLVRAGRQRLRERGRHCSGAYRRRRWTRSSSPRAPKARPARSAHPKPPGALSAADEFLKATAAHDHRERRLSRTRPDRGHVRRGRQRHRERLPSRRRRPRRSASEPPAGVLLLSPFARAGARPTTAFNPTSPKQSLSGLLH